MITVRYAIRDGYGEWQEAVGKGTTVEFRLVGLGEGSLSLGGRTAEIKDGACKINVRGLAYGQYTPLIITDTGIIQDLDFCTPLKFCDDSALFIREATHIGRL